MKKMFSVLLVVVLMMSLSVTAFATNYTQAQDVSSPVTATYVAGGAGGTVFSVDVEWSAMNFTYQAPKWAQWDAENHKYTDAVSGGWTGSGTVTITNHSNVALDVTPGYTMNSGYADTILVFKDGDTAINGAMIVASAADTNAAVEKTITVTADGKLASGASQTEIGSVKVTIAESDYVSLETAQILYQNMNDLASAMENSGHTDANVFRTYAVGFYGSIYSFKNGTIDQTTFNSRYASALADYNQYMAMM